jgi:hypothetical protein
MDHDQQVTVGPATPAEPNWAQAIRDQSIRNRGRLESLGGEGGQFVGNTTHGSPIKSARQRLHRLAISYGFRCYHQGATPMERLPRQALHGSRFTLLQSLEDAVPTSPCVCSRRQVSSQCALTGL